MRLPFGAVRKVVDPDGEYWGIYTSRTAPVGWKEGQYSGPDDMDGRFGIVALPLMLFDLVWSSLVIPVLRLIFITPFASIKGRRSNAVWIYAVTLYGAARETRTWTTTVDQADSVINEIANALEEGKITQPAGAVYSGSRDD
jgi:hypothetical protein